MYSLDSRDSGFAEVPLATAHSRELGRLTVKKLLSHPRWPSPVPIPLLQAFGHQVLKPSKQLRLDEPTNHLDLGAIDWLQQPSVPKCQMGLASLVVCL